MDPSYFQQRFLTYFISWTHLWSGKNYDSFSEQRFLTHKIKHTGVQREPII